MVPARLYRLRIFIYSFRKASLPSGSASAFIIPSSPGRRAPIRTGHGTPTGISVQRFGPQGPTGTGELLSTAASGQGTAASVEASVFATAPSIGCDSSHPASVALPGPRIRTAGAGGSQRHEASPGSVARAARGRSTSAVAFRTSGLADLSRAAVTGATSSRRLDPERSERVDGGPGAQSPVVCGPGVARLADIPALFAVSASRLTTASGTTALPSSLTKSGEEATSPTNLRPTTNALSLREEPTPPHPLTGRGN